MSSKNVMVAPDSPSGELDQNETGPLKLQRAKTMPKSCLVLNAEPPPTDPTVRPTRSVSFRDADQVLVFGSNDAPMACGPDWDPDKFNEDSDDDDLNLLFTKKAVIAPPKRVVSEPPASHRPRKAAGSVSSPLSQKKPVLPQWKANMNFAPRKGSPGEQVWLRTMSFDGVRNILYCTVNVRAGRDRHVIARCTDDGWKSLKDHSATLAEHIPTMEMGVDTYILEVPVPQPITHGMVLEFCLCARLSGVENWDNNGGSNYRVMFEKLSLN